MYPTPMNKGRDGVYRQAAARLLVAANDNDEMTEPLCRQSYDLERALAGWLEQRKEAA